MNKSRPESGRRTGHTLGSVDWIMGGVIASVLLATTACGGAPASSEVRASDTSSPSSVATSASPTTVPTDVQDETPLDPASVPTVDDAVPQAANPSQPAYATRALDLLSTLAVKGRAPKTGYDRAEFGQAWADVDRNGCDTRNDMLRRDLTELTLKAGTGDCVVLTGKLNEPYTGVVLPFTRGTTSSAVQIDHVVALGDAWQKGAQQLTKAQRIAFANDPLNLLAVSGPINQQKGAGDAATWLPPNKPYRCEYVARQISVKANYKLWVTQAEHDAMAGVLANCADTLAPTNQTAPAATAPPAPATPAAAQPPAVQPAPVQQTVAPPAPAPAPAAVYYANCSAARAAGAAPIQVGQAGYSRTLDRDGDGIACE